MPIGVVAGLVMAGSLLYLERRGLRMPGVLCQALAKTSFSSSTSPSWSCGPAAGSAPRRCFAGSARGARWCARTSSSMWPASIGRGTSEEQLEETNFTADACGDSGQSPPPQPRDESVYLAQVIIQAGQIYCQIKFALRASLLSHF